MYLSKQKPASFWTTELFLLTKAIEVVTHMCSPHLAVKDSMNIQKPHDHQQFNTFSLKKACIITRTRALCCLTILLNLIGLHLLTRPFFRNNNSLGILTTSMKGARLLQIVSNFMRFWNQKKAHIFLIAPVEFYDWKMYHLEDINENMTSYGNHN